MFVRIGTSGGSRNMAPNGRSRVLPVGLLIHRLRSSPTGEIERVVVPVGPNNAGTEADWVYSST